jgi:hypothetical protein
MDSSAPGVHPQHALAIYAESLAAGARVAVFGDASLGLGAKLAELGARAVHFWDPDTGRARDEAERSPRGVTIRAYSEQDADMRPIDLAIVADLGLFDDPSAIVRRVRRMVGEEGVAIIAARSAESARDRAPALAVKASRSFDYYVLFDLVAPEFDSVRMVAQLPFYGVALVELGDEDEAPGVSVDTQLGDSGRPPEAFVVVASQRGARLEPYTIVQLSGVSGSVDREESPDDAPPARVLVEQEQERAAEQERVAGRERERAAEQEQERVAGRERERAAEQEHVAGRERQRAAELEQERTIGRERERAFEQEQQRAAGRERQLAAEKAAAEAARAADREALVQAQLRTELLTGQLDDLRRRLAEGERAAGSVAALEEALRARTAHAADLESAFSARSRELAELSSEVEEVRAAAEAGRIAAAQVAEVALRSDRAERRVAVLEQELAAGVGTQSKELADLEGVLRERSGAVRSLEAELARREQIVRDLVGTLEELEARSTEAAQTKPEVFARQDGQVVSSPAAGLAEALAASAALGEENARLRAQLDLLALDLARREGEAQATAWQVTELERRLALVAEAPARPPSGPGTDRQLTDALDQLDALRAALAQEHEARARAESGEELTRAQAEIQRQAVLMEQLVRELGSRAPSSFGAGAAGPGDPGSDSSEDSR